MNRKVSELDTATSVDQTDYLLVNDTSANTTKKIAVDDFNTYIKNNVVNAYVRTTDPVVTDDVTGGYLVGDRWLNTTNNTESICFDNSAGASVWVSQGASIVDMQEFTSSGTWTAPSNANYIFLYGIGGGGGAGGITNYYENGGAGGSTIITGTNFNITLGGGGGGKGHPTYGAGLNGSVSYSLNSYFTIPIEKDSYGVHRSMLYDGTSTVSYRQMKKGTYYGAGGYYGGARYEGSNGGDGGSIQIYIKDFPNSLTINIGSAGSADGNSSSSGMGNSGQVKIISFG